MTDFNLLFDQAPNPYLILDPGFRIVAVNQAYLNATMTRRDMLLGRYLFEAFPANPDDLNADGMSNLQALQASNTELKKANAAKSMFLASMSHELRTPLNAVIGFAQVLDIECSACLEGRRRDSIEQILQSGKHLLGLINDVLDFAKVEAGKTEIHTEPVNVDGIIEECIRLSDHPGYRAHKVAVSFGSQPGCPLVLADRNRIKQVIFNLLSNAIKYNRPQGEVRVSVEPGRSHVRINVADTGPGIPFQKQKDLFKPFKRLGAETTTIEGTGIGLTIARQMMELMNGRIGVNSQPGKGSTFWIEIPLAHEKATDSPRIPVRETGALVRHLQGRVLYIKDSLANRNLMTMIARTIRGLAAGFDMYLTKPIDVIKLSQTLARILEPD